VLAGVYTCDVSDLVDAADRKHLPNADLLILDTYVRPISPDAGAQELARKRQREPNLALRTIRKQERRETRHEFAEAMARIAFELGEDVCPDEKYVERLESGAVLWPHPPYRRVLSALCGRPIGELGFIEPVLSLPDFPVPVDSNPGNAAPMQPRDVTLTRPNLSLRDAIMASGMEVSQLAHKVGVDSKTVQRWITRGRIPHPRHRWKTCQILGCDESEIWSGTGTSESRSQGRSEGLALGQQFDMVHGIMQRFRRAERLTIASPAHLQEILIHLREQWHALVKTDNLLGPRFALAGVLNQISVIEALRSILRDEQRIEVVRLGAKYAESAAWLYEDTDNMTQARSWTSQAMEWAYEGNDERMLAWTIFRRAQQAAAIPDAAQAIGLAQAARRNEEQLATPTRAAIRVQEAYGHALDGNDQAAQRLLDEAHTWAAGDTVGDAHEGHGSYCTPGYIEIQRATCWLAAGQPKKAISLYEDSLCTLPTVYQRNRAAALTRLAVAYVADSQPEQAANTAHGALPVARSAGSKRIVGEIKNVGTELIPYRALPAVAALLDELDAEDH
jgi:transcriptional regulator with XRE-family HTH domain